MLSDYLSIFWLSILYGSVYSSSLNEKQAPQLTGKNIFLLALECVENHPVNMFPFSKLL
jgi:hypothetical protein